MRLHGSRNQAQNKTFYHLHSKNKVGILFSLNFLCPCSMLHAPRCMLSIVTRILWAKSNCFNLFVHHRTKTIDSIPTFSSNVSLSDSSRCVTSFVSVPDYAQCDVNILRINVYN